MSKLDKCIRLVQAALILAFVLHFAGAIVQLVQTVGLSDQYGHVWADKASYFSRSLFDVAYAFFYLGEVVLIELLFRIWNSKSDGLLRRGAG